MPAQSSFFPNSNTKSSVQDIPAPQPDAPLTITYVCVPPPPVINLLGNPSVDSTLSNRNMQPDVADESIIKSKSVSFFSIFM